MKIEFTCEHCRSVLRLPAEHAGKRARCPVCSSLVLVPLETGNADVTSSSENSGQAPDNAAWGGYRPADNLIDPEPLAKPIDTIPPASVLFSTDQTPPHQSAPVPPSPYPSASPASQNPNPFAAPQGVPAGYYAAPQTRSPDNDGVWIAGLIIGIFSIFIQFGCCWVGAIPALPLSIIGLVCTFFSKSPYRWVCFVLNGIGLLISCCWIAFFVFFIMMDATF